MARESAVNFGDLDDVDGTAPTIGDVATWNGTLWAPATGGGSSGGSDMVIVEYAARRNIANLAVIASDDFDGVPVPTRNIRVALTAQTTALENGIYDFTSGTGALTRTTGFDVGDTTHGFLCHVRGEPSLGGGLDGLTQHGVLYRVYPSTSAPPGTIGTDVLLFRSILAAAQAEDNTERLARGQVVVCAGKTTSNIDLAVALGNYDGVVFSNAPHAALLVNDQTLPAENGIYVQSSDVSSDNWVRHPMYPAGTTMAGSLVYVAKGTTHENSWWSHTASTAGVPASTASQIGNASHQLNDVLFAKKAEVYAAGVSVTNINIASPGGTIGGKVLNVLEILPAIVLLAGQTTTSENGPWVWTAATSPLTRPAWHDTGDTFVGARVTVAGGAYAGSSWKQTSYPNRFADNVDTNNQAWRPDSHTIQCGAMGGVLAIGSGTGTPFPIPHEWLLADSLTGICTTAPVGAPVVFDVRIEPAGTVISTGTVAAAAQVATFTVFADTQIVAGSWLETRVTGIGLGPAGSDLSVSGLAATR